MAANYFCETNRTTSYFHKTTTDQPLWNNNSKKQKQLQAQAILFLFFFILKMIEERVERGRTESSQKLSSVKQKRETSKTLYEKLGHKTHLREAWTQLGETEKRMNFICAFDFLS